MHLSVLILNLKTQLICRNLKKMLRVSKLPHAALILFSRSQHLIQYIDLYQHFPAGFAELKQCQCGKRRQLKTSHLSPLESSIAL